MPKRGSLLSLSVFCLPEFNELTQLEVHGASDFILDGVLVHDPKDNSVGAEWHLNRDPNFLLNVCNHLGARCLFHLCSDFFTQVDYLYIHVHRAGANESCVKLWHVVRDDKAQFELFESPSNLRWHQQLLVGVLRRALQLQQLLSVVLTRNRQRNLKISCN